MTTDSRLILVGQIGGGFGVRGEVRVTAFTADPLALTAYGPLLRADGTVALTLTSTRPDKNGVVGRAKEIATKEQADALRGLKLHVPATASPNRTRTNSTSPTSWAFEVRDTAGEVMGTVKSVQNFGADDMLEIAPAPAARPGICPSPRKRRPNCTWPTAGFWPCRRPRWASASRTSCCLRPRRPGRSS
jgi:16S rRNA processing protein RimM